MKNDACLFVDNVTKKYKHLTVFESFSMQAAKGEIVALVGKNGAGKSTLIKMIAGIVRPTEGDILVDGISVKSNRLRYAEKIAYMPDYFRFPKQLTVEEFLTFYCRLRNADVKTLSKIIEKVGLSEKRKAKTASLSKGMGQRLMLAALLMSDAKLYLLDEPTNGLDDEWTHRFVEMMKELKSQKRTIVFSTHDREIANRLSDKIVPIT